MHDVALAERRRLEEIFWLGLNKSDCQLNPSVLHELKLVIKRVQIRFQEIDERKVETEEWKVQEEGGVYREMIVCLNVVGESEVYSLVVEGQADPILGPRSSRDMRFHFYSGAAVLSSFHVTEIDEGSATSVLCVACPEMRISRFTFEDQNELIKFAKEIASILGKTHKNLLLLPVGRSYRLNSIQRVGMETIVEKTSIKKEQDGSNWIPNLTEDPERPRLSRCSDSFKATFDGVTATQIQLTSLEGVAFSDSNLPLKVTNLLDLATRSCAENLSLSFVYLVQLSTPSNPSPLQSSITSLSRYDSSCFAPPPRFNLGLHIEVLESSNSDGNNACVLKLLDESHVFVGLSDDPMRTFKYADWHFFNTFSRQIRSLLEN